MQAVAAQKDSIPENAELHADYMTPGSDNYNEAVSAVKEQLSDDLDADKTGVSLEYVFYDIYFMEDGKRVEPDNGDVQVTVKFKNPALSSTDGKILNLDVVHVDDSGNAEIVTDDVETNGNGKITSMTFTQSSFSPVGVVRTTGSSAPENAADSVDLNKGVRTDGTGGKITKVQMEMYIDGRWMDLDEVSAWLAADEGNKIPKDTQVSVIVSFEMGENAVLDENSTILYTLPEAFAVISEKNVSMYDTDSPNEIIGAYSIDDKGLVTITPDTDFLQDHEWKISEGSFHFEGTFTEEWWNDPQSIPFGGDVGDVDIPFGSSDAVIGNLTINKEQKGAINYEDGTIPYTITVQAPGDNTVNMTDVTVKDTVRLNNTSASSYLEVDSSSIKATVTGADGHVVEGITPSWENGRWVIGEMAPGTTCTIEYNLKVKSGYTLYDAALQGTVDNTAEVYSGDTSMGAASGQCTIKNTLDITKDIIPDSKDSSQSFWVKDGKLYVYYRLTVTAPDNNDSAISNVTVKDTYASASQKKYVETYIFDSEEENIKLDSEDKSFTWNVGTLNPGESVILEYKVQVDNNILTADTSTGSSVTASLKNTASLQINGEETATAEATATATKQWITKSGKYVNGNTIEFTLTVNGGAPYGIGAINYIHDQLVGDFEYTGDLTICYYYQGAKEATETQVLSFENGITITDSGTDSQDRRVQEWTLSREKAEESSALTYIGSDYAQYWDGNYKIVLTYRVQQTGEMTMPTVANHAGIGGPVGQHSADWMGSNQESASVTKKCLSGQDEIQSRTARWQSTIPVNVLKGSTYTDWTQGTEVMWLTQEQLDAITLTYEDADNPDSTDGVYTMKKGTDASDPDADYYIVGDGKTGEGDDVRYKGFTITFLKDTEVVNKGNPILITYQTTLGTENIINEGSSQTSKNYYNYCQFSLGGEHTATSQASCTYQKVMDISKEVGKIYKEAEDGMEAGTITWFLNVNQGGTMYGDADITETIPEGLRFEDAFLVDKDGNRMDPDDLGITMTVTGANGDSGESSEAADASGGTEVKISLGGIQVDTAIRIEIVTTIEDYETILTEDADETLTFKNTASLTFDGDQWDVSAQASLDMNKISKSCNSSDQSLWPYAQYTVVVNPEGLDLGQTEDTTSMTFTDAMTVTQVTDSDNQTIYQQKDSGEYTEEEIYYRDNAAEIKTDDLQVIYYITDENGNETAVTAVPSDTVTCSADGAAYVVKSTEKQGFSLEIPDNVKVQITYNVMFNVLSGWTVNISNNASYEGISTIQKENEAAIQVHDPTGTLRSNGHISLEKRDADTRSLLAGAKFKLERMELDDNGEVVITQISAKSSDSSEDLWETDENGEINFTNLIKTSGGRAVIYRYTEMEAPEGYQLDDTPHYFAFTTVDATTLAKVKAALGVDDIIITPALSGNQYTIENETIKGSITVTKRTSVIDENTFDIVAMPVTDATFYVGLFTDAEGTRPYGDDYIRAIHIQDASSGTAVFDELPLGMTYYVFETDANGNALPYRESRTVSADASGTYYCQGEGEDGGVQAISLALGSETQDASVQLNNVYSGTLPEGFAYESSITITKNVIKNGSAADTSEVFYAGIFTSEDAAEPYKVVTLKNNGSVTVNVPLGGEDGMEPVTYYIYETDANGNKIDKTSFAYAVGGEGAVSLDTSSTTGTITITNTSKEELTGTETIGENTSSGSDSSGDNSSGSSGTSDSGSGGSSGSSDTWSSSAKTGDNNRPVLWALFFAAAAAGIIITLRKRGRHVRR